MPACGLFREGTEKVRHIQRKKAGSSPRAQQACSAAPCPKHHACCFSSFHHILTWDDSGFDRKGAFKLRNSPWQRKLKGWNQTRLDVTPDSTIISYVALDKLLLLSQPNKDKKILFRCMCEWQTISALLSEGLFSCPVFIVQLGAILLQRLPRAAASVHVTLHASDPHIPGSGL